MSLQTVPISKIVQGENVRTDITKESLKSLIESIKDKGILQPLLLSKKGDKYEIVAGHRRFNSAVHAGLKEVPALITTVDKADRIEYQLTENLQRIDLNPIDEALAYQALGEEFKPEDIVIVSGKSLYRIKKVLSLLNLSKEMQDMVKKKEISESHAFIISKLKSPKAQKSLVSRIKRFKYTPEKAESELRDYSLRLENALFDKKECKGCAFNGTEMKDLFDKDDVKGRCLNVDCYNKKVANLQKELKEKLIKRFAHKKDHQVIIIKQEPQYGSKEYKALADLIDFGGYQAQEFSKQIFKDECTATCPTFMHVIDPHGKASSFCANSACFQRNLKRSKAVAAKAMAIKSSGKKGKLSEVSEEDMAVQRKAEYELKRKESRVDTFKREFYLNNLGKKVTELQILKLLVDQLFSSEHGSKMTISELLKHKKITENYMVRDCWNEIDKLTPVRLRQIMKLIIVSRLPNYSTKDLQSFGEEAKVNIAKEFVISKEYLEKFSKQGLVKLAKELKLKTDLNFGKGKKDAMIEIVMKLGVKGKVPKEIIK